MRTPAALLLPIVLGGFLTSSASDHPHAVALDRIAPNDNRVAAGTLNDGVLTVRLEVRAGDWRPDADNASGLEVLAFAEEGRALSVPGPLIRVTEGTEIRAAIHNTQKDAPLVVHGLYTRPAVAGTKDTLHIAAGATREVRFQAGAPGTYYYWASTTNQAPGPIAPFNRRGRESQLSGALIVDPRGQRAAQDRVFVLGVWSEAELLQQGVDAPRQVVRFVINGKSWPNTERLSYNEGDTIRWRIINTNDAVHPMHLHGFYFRVHSRGGEGADTIYAPNAAPHLAVTERVAPSRTTSISWIPERAGNWLFHCHDNAHIQLQLPLDGSALPRASHVGNHTSELMQGLVMGVHVRPLRTVAPPVEAANRRRLRLVAASDPNAATSDLAFRFILQDPVASATTSARGSVGPPIVLRRGEPVSITVVNQLPEATAVHWHGIELESYYDGVADFAGLGTRIAPVIAAKDSFEARFTPPRAGTFIYHTHVDEIRQQRAGLAGALLVLEPGATYDPQTDLVMLISTPRVETDLPTKVLLNGSDAPAPLELRAGTRYRIRIINIHTFRPSMRFELTRGTEMLSWRALAKDGADLPAERATVRRSVQQISNGETYDFEFTPTAPGDLRVDVRTGVGVLLVTMPLRVR